MTELDEKLRWEETQRRKLHNQVQELKGNIRVRPLLGDEMGANGAEIRHIQFEGERYVVLLVQLFRNISTTPKVTGEGNPAVALVK